MSYKSLDEYVKAELSDDFHLHKSEAKKAIRKKDFVSASIAIGYMVATFDLIYEQNQILLRENHHLKKAENKT